MTEGWRWYDWINDRNSGYRRFEHIHSQNDFGRGLQSTSHIKTIWDQLIQNLNLLNKWNNHLIYYILERRLNGKLKPKIPYNEKIVDIFSNYSLVIFVGNDNIIIDEHFLSNKDINHYINRK